MRLFAIDLEEREIEMFTGQSYGPGDDDYRWPLKDALGATYLDHDFIEVIRLKDLAAIGFSGYLTSGIGLPEEVIENDKDMLDGLGGHVLLVLSQAFDGVAQTLSPKPPLRAIATYEEPQARPSYDPIHADAAKGHVDHADEGNAEAPGRRVMAWPIMLAALVLAAVVVLALSFGGSN